MSLRDVVELADAAFLSGRPLPKALDGRYDSQVKPLTDTTVKHDTQSDLHKLVTSVQSRVKEGSSIISKFSPNTIPAFFDFAANPDRLNDRLKVFTTLLSMLAAMPAGSKESNDLNDKVITMLYTTLPHPPATFIGTDFPGAPDSWAPSMGSTSNTGTPWTSTPRLPYTFRSADGSGNNVSMPLLGKARMPYARSVQNKHPVARNVLPDAGDVFDSLLKARDWKPHQGGNSSLTFAFASLVTHQLFRTDPQDPTKNNTSSYLDLSILYGTSQEQQDSVRDKAQGRGLLYPDAFAEDRLIFIPPSASALLVLFSRNHNYIAKMILQLNERGLWKSPPPDDPVKRAAQDEEIFQVARLVNCGNFMAMIFGDYVAGFLGLGRDGSSWSMNPFDPITTSTGEVVTRGDGNHCSVEFSILYRWHPTTARKDIDRTAALFKDAFQGKAADELGLADFMPAVARTWRNVEQDPRKRTFSNLQRGPDGRFSDDDLARVLQDATAEAAGAYRARGTPSVLRIVEMLGIEQARTWGVCTMNEFREFLKLKRFEDFEEWNPDHEIANAARQLYGHIDNLELYPGLQAEEILGKGPASGLCAGFTMTRAILSDAIALVRGDRFYTTDYTPGNLTVWGFQDCARDPDNGAFGAAMPRLLFRHLPRHYPANNIYALFPFFTPEATTENLKNLKLSKAYTFDRPVARPPPTIVENLAEITKILGDVDHYRTAESDIFRESAACKFSVVPNLARSRQEALVKSIFPSSEAFNKHKTWLGDTVLKLIKQHTHVIDGLPGKRVDVVGNVVNLAPIYWVSEFVLGLKLKTVDNENGLLTPQEVVDLVRRIFNSVYLNVNPENAWSNSKKASQSAQALTQLVERALTDIDDLLPSLSKTLSLSRLLSDSHKPSHDFLKNMTKAPVGHATNHQELVADAIGFAVAVSASLAKTAALVVNFYLQNKDHAKECDEVVRLAAANDSASTELFKGYIREAQRLEPQFAAVLREPRGDKTGKLFVLNLKKALVDATTFPEPLSINPKRPVASYEAVHKASFYDILGTSNAEEMLVEMIRPVFRLKKMRRINGSAGTIGRATDSRFGVDHSVFANQIGLATDWPNALQVVYDG